MRVNKNIIEEVAEDITFAELGKELNDDLGVSVKDVRLVFNIISDYLEMHLRTNNDKDVLLHGLGRFKINKNRLHKHLNSQEKRVYKKKK